MTTTAGTSVPAGPRRRVTGIFWAAVAALALAGVAARFNGLGIQSYWTDEAFSVLQASRDLAHLWEVGRTEVHPPLFALLLLGWEQLGGQGPVWTRSLTALLGSVAVAVSWLGLRHSGIGPTARGLIVAATATSGFAITYAQEVRPYALLWLAAVGLTAATLAIRADGPRRQWLPWAAWGALASGTHLFGAVLVAVCVAVALTTLRRQFVAGLAATGVALLPQVAWLGYGLTVPGFASGASTWIESPGLGDIGRLLTTVFAAGRLSMREDGFLWASPWLIVALAGIAAVALLGLRRAEPGRPAERRATAVLAAIALVTVAATFLVSQVVHLWTLRNLIVVAPAATWAAVCLPLALARTRWVRTVVAAATLAALAVGLVSVWWELAGTRYKTDYAGAMEYLAAVRSEQPAARFFVSTENPDAWMMSADLPQDPAYLSWLLGADAVLLPKEDFHTALEPVDGVSVYVWYRSTDPSRAAGREAAMLDRLGREQCVPVPLQGIAVVRCDRP